MDNFNVSANYQNNQNSLVQTKKRFSGPKIVFVILGIALLIEIIYAAKVLIFPASPPSQPVRQAVVAQVVPGSISLDAPKTSFQVGEIVPVSVKIDTGGRTIGGADVMIHFDPKVLEVAPADLVKGEIFEEYPLKSIDTKNGLIYISGINSSKTGFEGMGEFATINLKAKLTGGTFLTIDFIKKEATIDSNLVETATAEDILETVNNLDIVIQ